MTSHYQVGASKIEILLPKRELPLMGYGDPNHRARESKTPLFVRTVLIEDPITGRKLAMCCLEIILITEALRMEILKRTGLKEEEILLTATHTHCAPGGHSNYVMYASITDGFHDDVFQSYVTAVIHSINKARTRIRPARIHFQTGEFHPSEEVAFNRSIRAWNQNTDTEKYSFADRHLAVDREMKLLRFEGIDGNPIASWNWFGVHATSMHRDYFFIHSDNKGLAASKFEATLKERGNPDFVAVFSQGPAGDVSPNFTRPFLSRELRGKFREDEKSCDFNAHLQAKKALEIYDRALATESLSTPFHGITEYYNFSNIETLDGHRTAPAEIGIPQLQGTMDGRGAIPPLIWILKLCIRVSYLGKSRNPNQAPKLSIIQSGEGKVLNTENLVHLVLPSWSNPIVALFKKWGKFPSIHERPFTPNILPLQFFQIGHLGIACLPSEFSVTAGRRVRAFLESRFKERGIDRVVIQAYANSSTSYVVTPEEYEAQEYEGGCTHFGKWTLSGYLTCFQTLIEKFKSGAAASSLRPSPPSPEFMEMIQTGNRKRPSSP